MRELKFRIWDIQDKSFLSQEYLKEFKVSISCDGQTIRQDFWGGDKTVGEDVIVQQYTGLKDKNNVEIYEGDIVKYSRCHVVSVEERKNVFSSKLIEDGDFVGEIIFIFPSFCWSYDHKRYDDIESMTGATHRYEVIGNTFETPELLK